MKRTLILLALAVLATASNLYAQTSVNQANWPVCLLGEAPIARGPAPPEAQVFKTTGGPVLMTEAGPPGREREARIISCQLAPDSEVYRSADGTLRDLPSNQPFWPIGWDATASQQIAGRDGKDGLQGLKGDPGPQGSKGDTGPQGFAALPPPYYLNPPSDKRGMSKTSKFLIGTGIVASALAGGACAAGWHGWCRTQETNVAQIVNIGGPVSPVITVTLH